MWNLIRRSFSMGNSKNSIVWLLASGACESRGALAAPCCHLAGGCPNHRARGAGEKSSEQSGVAMRCLIRYIERECNCNLATAATKSERGACTCSQFRLLPELISFDSSRRERQIDLLSSDIRRVHFHPSACE